MDKTEELRGVGGWLAFFVVILAVISPLRILIGLFSSLYDDPMVAEAFGDRWTTVQAFEWTVAITAILTGWFLAWRLISVRTWKTVRIVVIGIWSLAIGFLAFEAIGIAVIAAAPLADVIIPMAPELIRPIIFCTIWTIYLGSSSRVANTYPRQAEAERMAGVFG